MSLQFKSEREARTFFAQIKRPFPGDAAREAGVAAVEAALLSSPDITLSGAGSKRDAGTVRRLGLLAVQAALTGGV